MAQRAGFADLPLHGGRVPPWLGVRMARLGRVIAEAIVHHYGPGELLARLAHPFWFQSFGAVMGMDWHSSGITTSVIGALKRGLSPISHELGVYVCTSRSGMVVAAQMRSTSASSRPERRTASRMARSSCPIWLATYKPIQAPTFAAYYRSSTVRAPFTCKVRDLPDPRRG